MYQRASEPKRPEHVSISLIDSCCCSVRFYGIFNAYEIANCQSDHIASYSIQFDSIWIDLIMYDSFVELKLLTQILICRDSLQSNQTRLGLFRDLIAIFCRIFPFLISYDFVLNDRMSIIVWTLAVGWIGYCDRCNHKRIIWCPIRKSFTPSTDPFESVSSGCLLWLSVDATKNKSGAVVSCLCWDNCFDVVWIKWEPIHFSSFESVMLMFFPIFLFVSLQTFWLELGLLD